MSDFRLKPSLVLVCGVSGSGKTTFTLRYLVNSEDVVCRFVFDFKADSQTGRGEFATRLDLPNQYTAKELEEALSTGWVLFNPRLMFPPDHEDGSEEQLKRAFVFFCRWVYSACKRGRGRKLFAIDEAWMYCSPNKLEPALATCIQAGRSEGLELIFQTQTPNKLHSSVVSQCTEIVVFTLRSSLAIEALQRENDELDQDTPKNLPPGSFWSLIRDTGAIVTGKVF